MIQGIDGLRMTSLTTTTFDKTCTESLGSAYMIIYACTFLCFSSILAVVDAICKLSIIKERTMTVGCKRRDTPLQVLVMPSCSILIRCQSRKALLKPRFSVWAPSVFRFENVHFWHACFKQTYIFCVGSLFSTDSRCIPVCPWVIQRRTWLLE